MSDKKKSLGKIVHEYRLRMGWSQEELSFNPVSAALKLGASSAMNARLH